MDNKTSDGLRNRLFNALDSFLEHKITMEEVEGVCYLSEQILKTANVELEFQKISDESKRLERDYNLKIKREENTAAELLQITLKKIEENA